MARNARRDRRWAVALSVVALLVAAVMASAEGAAAERQTAVCGPPASRDPDRAEVQAAPARGVRPQGQEAEDLLAEARRLSPTVRGQLAELERSDLLVYLEVRLMPFCRTSHLAFVARAGGVRYLKIEIDRRNYRSAGIMWLAHELQHAIEIASAADVTDVAGFVHLYRRIGRRSFNGAGEFETAAAIRVGRQVQAELGSAPSPLTAGRPPR
jgi:hypothetical protein